MDWHEIRGNEQVFNRLHSLVQSTEAIAFVGAGASAELYPLWAGLIRQLADEAVNYGRAGDDERAFWLRTCSDSPDQVVRGIKEKLKGYYADALRKIFRPKPGPDGNHFTGLHAALLRLGFKGYITTNFDIGLLEARRALRPDIPAIGFDTWKDDAIVDRWYTGDIFVEPPCPVLFAHGVYNRPDTVVLGAAEYREAYRPGGPFRRLFLSLLGQRRLAFVGFSFADPWFNFLASAALLTGGGRRTEAPRHVALLGLRDDEHYSPVMRDEFVDQYDAEPLFYPVAQRANSEDHSALQAILQALLPPPTPIPPRPPPLPPPPSPKLFVKHLRLTGFNALDREMELKELDAAWQTPTIRVFTLVAWGGVGKTTLVNHWLEKIGNGTSDGASRVYGWSFNGRVTKDQIVSGDDFIRDALTQLGDPDPDFGSPWAKGERLADLIRQEKTLLILDGLEALQTGDDTGPSPVVDPAVALLICELAQINNGLCLITTRSPIAQLEGIPECHIRNLENISQVTGRNLLKIRGVCGNDDELEAASAEFGNNALAVSLLASYLCEHPNREVSAYQQIPKIAHSDSTIHARRVLAAWETKFGENAPETQLLHLISAFDGPATKDELGYVLQSRVQGLNDSLPAITDMAWLFLLERLSQWELVVPTRDSDPYERTYDLHPVVRIYFREGIAQNQDLWRSVHMAIFEYLRTSIDGLARNAAERLCFYRAIRHACAAGCFDKASSLYSERIRQERKFFTDRDYRILPADLAMWSNFFVKPWDVFHAELQTWESWKTFVLSEVAWDLFALGRSKEAIAPAQSALDIAKRRARWVEAAIIAEHLATFWLTLGDLDPAQMAADWSLDFAEKVDSNEALYWQINACVLLAHIFHQRGELTRAEDLLAKAKQKAEGKSDLRLFHGLWGYYYGEFLLTKGDIRSARRFAESAILATSKVQRDEPLEIDDAMELISLGRAFAADGQITRDLTRANAVIDEAIEKLRDIGRQDTIAIGLMARAEVRFKQRPSDYMGARRCVDAAMAIAKRGSMALLKADIHLQYACICLGEGDVPSALDHLEQAKNIICNKGYRRKLTDIDTIARKIERRKSLSGH